MPKSVVFIIFSFPSTFTNSFHTVRFSFLLFWFGLGLALLCWLTILFGLGNLGLVGLGIVGLGLALLCWLAILFGFGNLLFGRFGIVGGLGFDSWGWF